MTDEEACAILGITGEDDAKAIESKYKKLMRAYHPDANADDPKAAGMASRINEAHDTILKSIEDGYYILPKKRREIPRDDAPTLSSLRRQEREKQRKEVFFTADDMLRLAEDMTGEMQEKPVDFDTARSQARVLRKMAAAHRGSAPDEVVRALRQFSEIENEVSMHQEKVAEATVALSGPGRTALEIEQIHSSTNGLQDLTRQEREEFELHLEEIRMAMYKLIDGRNPQYGQALDDAENYADNEVQSTELEVSLSTCEKVCSDIRHSIELGKSDLDEYRAWRKHRTVTVAASVAIALVGIVISWLLITRM